MTRFRRSGVGNFDGIDAMLNRADAVVVARLVRNIPFAPNSHGLIIGRVNDSSEPYACEIVQSLKGGLRPQSTVRLCIEDFQRNCPVPLSEGVVQILFLRKHPKDRDGIEYDTLRYEGANINIAPVGSEAVPQTGTPKERIKALVQHYRLYRENQARREDDLLQRVLRS